PSPTASSWRGCCSPSSSRSTSRAGRRRSRGGAMASSLDEAAEDEGPLAAINIIPFVDIVLVLLVIFMLTSATIVRASLKVDLPKAASGGSKVESTLSFMRTKGGELFLNGQKLGSIAEAADIVRREVAANPK